MFGLKKKLFGGESRVYRQEIGGAWGSFKNLNATGLAAGLVEGTYVATAMGWRPVEAITKGDLVLTFDRGMQPVHAISRGALWDADNPCPRSLWPLSVPAGALGNQDAMVLLPEQCAMVESDAADMLFGDPFALVHGRDLEGFRGIERVEPTGQPAVIQLHFEDGEVVFASSGALVLCPSLRVINMTDLIETRPDATRYAPLSAKCAEMLVDCMADEDASVTEPWPGTEGPIAQAMHG